jgi:hypothetical protein
MATMSIVEMYSAYINGYSTNRKNELSLEQWLQLKDFFKNNPEAKENARTKIGISRIARSNTNFSG